MSRPNVVAMISRCSTARQPFGIRLEETGRRNWMVTWAFPVKESTAGKEGYDRSSIDGSFSTTDDYPGCTSCGATSLVLCNNCSKLGCWRGDQRVYTCPWCGSSGVVEGEITSLQAGRDV
ncbi:hypothetical protein Aab01nite_31790 [Paractinoplanes abujensis]|uniref:Putative RNA-binding Zn-ribbon protein involved in translation (DUF1610 family) n=1 Tax=Paractinoplanes abujensis TaxID=882441 RepID=A0A7W7G6U5_9ACTN|nr:TerY-C metal binding domain-containing protein [Actinoplanes abujensis]MBB4697929.1 putative RNA-binding Zn-ribbon protein involved in translation (DUF1610 family) [Actinoplanes abujensis]GID19589.1 hypothetical protein Aab01nite_31790 [Actinoplanes abujensis]